MNACKFVIKLLLVSTLLLFCPSCRTAQPPRGPTLWDFGPKRKADVVIITSLSCIKSRQRKREEHIENMKAMLTDGRIHVGITQRDFARLWGKPHDIVIDRSTGNYGVSEWWAYNSSCYPIWLSHSTYAFHFMNGILDYWSEIFPKP